MQKISVWIEAFRLRTLALSFSIIVAGCGVAMQEGCFDLRTMLLAMLTTLCLQILSNLSNDYGDAAHGVDNDDRIGPQRAVQSGRISAPAMKRAMLVFGLLSLASGIGLLASALGVIRTGGFVFLLAVGLLCIASAICYTVGRRPYGYRGWGDFSVFVFFGLVGVVGTVTLQTGTIELPAVLVAAAIGFFSTAVLNMNNMRDVDNDRASCKTTLVVRMGFEWGRRYQMALIAAAWLCLVVETLLTFSTALQLIYLATLPIFAMHLRFVARCDRPALLDGQLRVVSVGTLATSVLFCAGCAMA